MNKQLDLVDIETQQRTLATGCVEKDRMKGTRTSCRWTFAILMASSVILCLTITFVWWQHTVRQDILDIRGQLDSLRAQHNASSSDGYHRNQKLEIKQSESDKETKSNIQTGHVKTTSLVEQETDIMQERRRRRDVTMRKTNATDSRPTSAVLNKQEKQLNNGDKVENKKRKNKVKAIHLNIVPTKYEALDMNSEEPILKWWKQLDWSSSKLSTNFKFDNNTGKLTIPEDGLYLIYSQVTYWNVRASNYYYVLTGENQTLTQCHLERRLPPTTVTSSENRMVDSCFTSTVAMLRKNQKIWIGNPHQGFFQPMLSDEYATFWGVVLLNA